MKRLIGVIVFSILSLYLQAIEIDSGFAEYKNQCVLLKDNACLKNEWGKIAAQEIQLYLDKKNLKLPVQAICKNHVCVFFTKGGQLTCDSITFDYLKLEGQIEGKKEAEYKQEFFDKITGKAIPFFLKSPHLVFHLDNKSDLQNALDHLTAKNVVVQYGDYELQADNCIFVQNEEFAPHGKITLSSQVKECLVKKENITINCSKVEIDTYNSLITFYKPSGFYKKENLESIYLESDQFLWDEGLQTATFLGNTSVKDPGYGKIFSEEKLVICVNDKKIRTISIHGKAKVEVGENEEEPLHQLHSYGTIEIDYDKGELKAKSPLGKEELQLVLEDYSGKASADDWLITYETMDKIKIKTMQLEGNVKIIHKAFTTDIFRYVIADFGKVNLQTQEIAFSALPKKKVLFVDHLKSLEMSAPELKISKDPLTLQEKIIGKGVVRFNLVEQELELMRKRFDLKKGWEKKNVNGK